MITLKHETFLIDSKPTILLAAEMHYFRIPKPLWETHIIKIKEAKCNVISTYVPWLIHEPVKDHYEFHGETLEQYDLISFLKLLVKHQLPLFFRPGPFVMAELYMEGVASYLKAYDELKPYTFGRIKVVNDQLDYLHPIFLDRTKRYFDALFQAVKPYMQSQGGPIFGVQLDNEIGMLAWVSQSPPLTEDVVTQLGSDFDLESYTFASSRHAIGHQKLGQILRERYQTYVDILESYVYAHEKDILTFINVHGTGGDRGLMFPIGYSQLVKTFKNRITGTDIYFTNLDFKNAHDYYMINSHLLALKDPHTPSTCLEFNGGNSDFGHNLYHHDTVQSMEKKIRLNMIQNHKMINYYLFSAGMNPLTHPSYVTGNHRIGSTGERHGFSAPLKLDGSKTYMYESISKTNTILMQYETFFAESKEVYANLTIGLMLDQFMTESMRHQTEIEALKVSLTKAREGILHETFIKHALFLHYNPKTIHLEALDEIDPIEIPILAISTSSYMDSKIQTMLVNYIKQGGKLLCFGELPVYNLEAIEDKTLIDYLEIKPSMILNDYMMPQLSVVYDQTIEGYHAFQTPYTQRMEHDQSSLFHDLDGHKLSYYSNQVLWITNHYPADLDITKRIGNMFGIKPVIESKTNGFAYIFKTALENQNMIHILNFESYPLEVVLQEFDHHVITIPPFENVMLPIHVNIHPYIQLTSTCECIHISPIELTFQTHHQEHVITFKTTYQILHEDCLKVEDGYVCHIKAHAKPTTHIRMVSQS